MKLETFFENFDLLSDAPNAVAKFRQLILELAVRGMLVPQDPKDEDAEMLLEKIDKEQGILINTSEVNEGSYPYNLPLSWKWIYLERVSGKIHYGYTASADFALTDVRLLRITDIQDNRVNWLAVPGCQITPSELEKFSLQESDLLIARTGETIGKSYLVESLSVVAVFASYLIRIVPCHNAFPKYLKLFLDSNLYWKQLYAKSMGTGQPNVNATSLKSLLVPLPPLPEQKRIVEKCDRLMTLCDQIEQRQQERQKRIVTMNEGAIAQLLSAQNPDEFTEHWNNICNNFDLLYSVPETIPKLRQAILQLAVMGKLVRQEPGDEDAGVLLSKVRTKVEKLIQQKAAKRIEPNPIEVEDEEFLVPSNWLWVRLGNLVQNIKYGTSKKCDYDLPGTPVLRIPNINVDAGEIDPTDLKFTALDRTELQDLSLQEDDLLMIRSNGSKALVGRTAVVDNDTSGYAYAGYLVIPIQFETA